MILLPAAVMGQQASREEGVPIVSMGQPPRWKPYLGGVAGFTSLSHETRVRYLGFAGLGRDLINPLLGITAVTEAYAGSFGHDFDWGARLGLAIQPIYLQPGLDWRIGDDSPAFILSLAAPLRRGGLFGHGTLLRADWLPSRNGMINVGVTVPVFQPWAGRTRPRQTTVPVPRAAFPPRGTAASPGAAATAPLSEMRRVSEFLLLAFDAYYAQRGDSYAGVLDSQRSVATSYISRAGVRDSVRPDGWLIEHEFAVWHAAMREALAAAAGDTSLGTDLARAARQSLLDSLLIPYDALFGQHKKPDDLSGLGERAGRALEAALPASLPAERRASVLGAFHAMVEILEAHRAGLARRNGNDSRYTWLYLQLGLLAAECDEQAEIDALIERLTGREFTDGNATLLMAGPQFQLELASQVLEARRFHVLWIHDYKGKSAASEPDSIGELQTLNYLRALRNAVLRYDSVGTLPSYFIFLDQNYYQSGRSRMWLTILEKPLQHNAELPPRFRGMERHFIAMQDSLRAAVAASARLTAEAKAHGRDWVDDRVKVHVSITNPADMTFRSKRIIGVSFIVPDNLVRDHRKIAFFDIVEEDPSSGRAAYAGVGVGEQYTSPTWDDRILVVKGPANLSLKTDLRRLLEQNGFRPEQVPAPFRAASLPAGYAGQVSELVDAGFGARALALHNEVGFGTKRSSVVQLALLTLVPSGSLVMIPDPIWTNMLWTSYLVQAALRGAHVLLVAPSWDNAPSQTTPTMARTWDVFSRLLVAQSALQAEIERAGGRLRVGFYTRESDINDAGARFGEIARTYAKYPWLRDEFRMDQATYRRLEGAEATVERTGIRAQRLIGDTLGREPKLHTKAQLFVSRQALDALYQEPTFASALGRQATSTLEVWFSPDNIGFPGQQRAPDALALVQAWDSLPAAARESAFAWFTLGSMNKDTRGLFLDGEVNCVIAGAWAMQGYLEMLFVAGLTTWPETVDELNTLFRPFSEKDRRRAYLIRKAI